MGADMKDEGGERIVHREGAGQKESDAGRGHYELVSPLFMRRLAIWLERGAIKYKARNWEKGIPQGRIMRALLRHAYEYLEGMKNEDHLAAISCNIMFLIHFEEGIKRGLYSPEDVEAMQNLPNYIKEDLIARLRVTEEEIKDDRALRLKSAADRYYMAKAEMEAIEKELICKFPDCQRLVESGKQCCVKHLELQAFPACAFRNCTNAADHGKWCVEHYPRANRVCGKPDCDTVIPRNHNFCLPHTETGDL